jgi:hypothetical protein
MTTDLLPFTVASRWSYLILPVKEELFYYENIRRKTAKP